MSISCEIQMNYKFSVDFRINKIQKDVNSDINYTEMNCTNKLLD